jgi:hypothetical protein
MFPIRENEVRDGSPGYRFITDDEDGEFALSGEQLASARDTRCDFRSLVEQSSKHAQLRRSGRPYDLWKDNLELARALNDHLAKDASD